MSDKVRRRFKENKIKINPKIILAIGISLLIVLMIFFVSKLFFKKENKQQAMVDEQINSLIQEINFESEEFMKPEDKTVNIAILGGVFCGPNILKDAYNDETNQYDFYSMFYKIANKISNADISLALLETNLVDESYNSKTKHNAPKELVETLKIIGIDILNTATNYCYDYGIEGIESTKNIIEENEIDSIGTYRTEEESNKILIKEIEGIKIAFLAYTYGTDKDIDDDYSYSVNIIDKEKIKQDIEKAKENNADFVFVNMHWGEYKSQIPNDEQRELTEYLIENGADVIIGTHPAQIQTMEHRQNNQGKDVIVAYSVGNFISEEQYENADTGLMLNIQLTKSSKTNEKYLSKVIYTPLYTYDKGKEDINRFEILDIRDEIKKYENDEEEKVSEETYNKIKEKIAIVEGIIGGNQ